MTTFCFTYWPARSASLFFKNEIGIILKSNAIILIVTNLILIALFEPCEPNEQIASFAL